VSFVMRFLMPLMALVLSSFNYASADIDLACKPITLQHEQCSFDVPALNGSGATSVISDSEYFAGASAAVCQNGVSSLVKPSCEVKVKSDCKIDETSWIKSGAMCSHSRLNKPLEDGNILTINDTYGNGSITYTCSAGNLEKSGSSCTSKSKVKVGAASNAKETIVSTQNAGTSEAHVNFIVQGRFDSSNYNSSPRVRTAAESECLKVDGYIPGSSPRVSYVGESPADSDEPYSYFDAVCQLDIELRCDQGVINPFLSGGYREGRGEFLNEPGTDEFNQACRREGYTGGLDTLLYLDREHGAGDTFIGTMICSGKQSSCESIDINGGAFTGFTSCDTGTVRTGLIEVPRGSEPTNSDYVNQCTAFNFENLAEVISGPRLHDSTGQFNYYDATIACATYVGPNTATGYPASCTDSETPQPPPPSVTPVTCDTAKVAGYVKAILDPATGRYDKLPGESSISNAICGTSGYTMLDSITSSTYYSTGQQFFVEALCSGNTNDDRTSCEVLGPCYGEELTLPTEEPTIEHNGKHYLNKCYTKPPPPSFLCEDCAAEDFMFTDSETGFTCTVESQNKMSGESYSFDFANANYNGTVEALCNNGVTSATDGTCFKSCPGGVYVDWDDKNGAKSCSQRVPNGTYIHDQVITLGSSVSNTGNATLRCDGYTGEWVVTSGECKLDCSDDAFWGTGTSNSGINKNGICRATPRNVSHNESGRLFSSTPGTTGQTNFTCNDGTLQLNSSQCDLECGASIETWGTYCSASIPALESGVTANYVHTGAAQVDTPNPTPTPVNPGPIAPDPGPIYSPGPIINPPVSTQSWSGTLRTSAACDPTQGMRDCGETEISLPGDGGGSTTQNCTWGDEQLLPGWDGWNARNAANCVDMASLPACDSTSPTAPFQECYTTREINDRYCQGYGKTSFCSAVVPDEPVIEDPEEPIIEDPEEPVWPALPEGPFPDTATGSVTLSCNDGVRQASNAQCKYVVEYTRGDWSDWSVDSSSTTKSPTDSEIENSPGTYTEQTITTTYQESRTRNVNVVYNDGTSSVSSTEREERERVDVEVIEIECTTCEDPGDPIPPDFSSLTVGCFVDDSGFNSPTFFCSGAQAPNTRYNISFIVGDTTYADPSNGYRRSWILSNPDEWEIEWMESCSNTSPSGSFCVVSGSSGGIHDRYAEVERNVKVTHVPSGSSRTYTIMSRVTFENFEF